MNFIGKIDKTDTPKDKCVVFCGWKGSGKDTFSNFLIRDYKFNRYAFADTLKDYCSETYNVPREHFDDINFKETKITDILSTAFNYSPRDLCIKVGKEYRELDPDYWIQLVFKKMENENKGKIDRNSNECNEGDGVKLPYFVISDCRYPNELKQLKLKFKDCLIIWVHRWETPPSTDLSEVSLGPDDCDIILDNTKLLRFRNLERIIQKFIKI